MEKTEVDIREIVKEAADPKESLQPDLIDELALAEMMPKMPVSLPEQQDTCIIEDQVLLGLYDEILNDCRHDRKSIDELLISFINMVMNDGDSSSASKEAIVNLVKIKSEVADKMAKIADLETRIKLKSPDTYKPYLTAHQHNNVTIQSSKRDILKSLTAAQKNKKEK